MNQYQEHEGYQEQFMHDTMEHPYTEYAEHVQHQMPVFVPPFSTSFRFIAVLLSRRLLVLKREEG